MRVECGMLELRAIIDLLSRQDVRHRLTSDFPLTSQSQVRNGVTLELTGPEHEAELVKKLTDAGYNVETYKTDPDKIISTPGFSGYREPVVPNVWKNED